MNFSISYCKNRHKPLVIVSAIRTINDTLMIGLNNTKILKSRTSGHHMSLISCRQLHCYAQRNQCKITFF